MTCTHYRSIKSGHRSCDACGDIIGSEEMTGREAHLKELKALQSPGEYFEGIRQIFDQLLDENPVDKSSLEVISDWRDATLKVEQELNRVQLVQGEP